MNAATITALSTGIPAVLGAITALIVALRSNSKANFTADKVIGHIVSSHTPVATAPVTAETEGATVMSEPQNPEQTQAAPIDGLSLMGLAAPVAPESPVESPESENPSQEQAAPEAAPVAPTAPDKVNPKQVLLDCAAALQKCAESL